MAESAGQAPLGGDQSRAPTIIGVYCTLTTISIACVGARLYTRFRLLRSPGMDDVVIVLSMCIVFTSFVLECYDTKFGSGRHTYYLSPQHILLASKWNYIAAPFGIVGLTVPKLAIAIFLKRIVGPTKRRTIAVLYFLTISNIIFSLIDVIFLFVQCSPTTASWNRSISHTCWNPAVLADFSFFVGAYSATIDLILALFPSSMVYRLQMSRKNKIAISLVMGLGVFSGICAIVRTIKLAAYQSALDYTWTSGESILWSGAEMNVIIICACVPTFLPLIQQVTGQRDYRSKPTADPITYRSGQQQLMRNKTSMQLLKPQTTKKSTKSQESERSLPDGAISRTTEIESRWESV